MRHWHDLHHKECISTAMVDIIILTIIGNFLPDTISSWQNVQQRITGTCQVCQT